MTFVDYRIMDLAELRRYVLSHREDLNAFQTYVDRSNAEGRMVSVNTSDSAWEIELAKTMPSYHHPQEQDYWGEQIEVENTVGQKTMIQTYLLRLYPQTFNGYDAYLDIPQAHNPDIKKVSSSRFEKRWEVVTGPTESQIRGYFRGDYTENNPPAWVLGLRLI
jgi:hypothetical protein